MQIFGIDVSHWQGNFDFNRAKKEGVQYAILKAGGGDAGLYQDSKFNTFYAAAKAAGLGVGAYFFGQAFSVDAAIKEADKFISILAGKQFDYPVYYDVEAKMLKQSKQALTDIICAFCDRVEKAGYYVGIYSSESVFNSQVNDTTLARYAHWVAKWSKNAPNMRYSGQPGMWQYGGETNFIRSNRIAGVVCDQDYCYTNYPAAIKKAGLNGYTKDGTSPAPVVDPKPTPVKPTKTVDELAQEVILGLWGNGADRKKKLTDAGYDYSAVQKRVDELFAAQTPAKKSNQEIAEEVVKGLWGVGDERKKKLREAGYNPSTIQRIVNKLMS